MLETGDCGLIGASVGQPKNAPPRFRTGQVTRVLVQGRPEVERSIDYVMRIDFMKGSLRPGCSTAMAAKVTFPAIFCSIVCFAVSPAFSLDVETLKKGVVRVTATTEEGKAKVGTGSLFGVRPMLPIL